MKSEIRKYSDAISFRQALEARLNTLSKEKNLDLERLRKQVAFDRLLARIFFNKDEPRWFLKGGYAMELRFLKIARATKDIDLSIPTIKPYQKVDDEFLAQIRERLQSLVERDLGEWFMCLIKVPIMELDAAPYGGARFPVEVRLGGKKFTNFNLDVGIGDAVIFEPEWREDHNFLKFAGISPAKIPLLPKEQQFAEKIHTYSFPREGTPNSRTRDLVDMVMLIENGLSDLVKTRRALQATFERRKTHSMPVTLTSPPESWEVPYRTLAEECGVNKKTIQEAFDCVSEFWKRIQTSI